MLYEAIIIDDDQKVLSCIGKKESACAWIHTQLQDYINATGTLRCLDHNAANAKSATYRANPQFD